MEANSLTHRDRIERCISGEETDRIPIALWRHFPVDDQSPYELAGAILEFQKLYDFDIVKVTPASSYCLRDWGSEDEWRGNTEGTREYTHRVINSPDDWYKLPVLDPNKGKLGAQLTCLKLIVDELGPNTPIVQTIFNPLSQAKNLAGGQKLIAHIHQYPEAVAEGLRIIAESTQKFIEAVCSLDIAGLFYAVQHASYQLLSEDEYIRLERKHDLELLNTASGKWLNMLHLHGNDIMFKLFIDYPVQVINWHDRETYPNLDVGQAQFNGVVCGGLQRNKTMELGNPEQVYTEARDAIMSTNKRRFILGTGCVLLITTPRANINAAIQSCKK